MFLFVYSSHITYLLTSYQYPLSLFSTTSYLVSMNCSLVTTTPSTPTQAKVEDTTNTLLYYIYITSTTTYHFVPSTPTISSTTSSLSSSTFYGTSTSASDLLTPFLGIAIEILYIGVEIFTHIVSEFLSYSSHTNYVQNNFATLVQSNEVPSNKEVIGKEEEREEEG